MGKLTQAPIRSSEEHADHSYENDPPIGVCSRRRRIPESAGRALEKLGHAIEYLADEAVYEGWTPESDHGRTDAIRILKSANRQIYYSCPVVPTLRERFAGLVKRVLKLEHKHS